MYETTRNYVSSAVLIHRCFEKYIMEGKQLEILCLLITVIVNSI